MNQVKAGVVLNYVLIVVNAIIGLAYTPYMLRKLGQTEYGLYSLAASMIAYLTIMDFGFGNAIIRYSAKFNALGKIKEKYSLYGMFIIIYAIIGLIALVCGIVLYYNTNAIFDRTMTLAELNTVRQMILVMVFNLAITFPFSVFGAIISAHEQFVFQRCVNLFRIALNTIVMVVLLHYGYKAFAMVIVQTVFNILTLICNCVFCLKVLKIKFIFGKFEKSLFREISIYSFWIFLNIIIDKIYWSTGQFVLGAIVGVTAVAVFSVAISLQGIYMSFSTAISSVFLPRITKIVANENDSKTISDVFIRTGRIQYSIMSLVLSGFIVFGKSFILIWAGENYLDSYAIVLIFFVALLVPMIQNIGITILQARNQMKFRSILYIWIAIIALICQIILSKYYGAIGCAVAIGGALLLGQGIVMNIYYYKYQNIDIPKFWVEIISMSIVPLLLTFLGCLCNKVVDYNNYKVWGMSVVVYILIYMVLFWLFSMNNYEKNLVKGVFRKI